MLWTQRQVQHKGNEACVAQNILLIFSRSPTGEVPQPHRRSQLENYWSQLVLCSRSKFESVDRITAYNKTDRDIFYTSGIQNCTSLAYRRTSGANKICYHTSIITTCTDRLTCLTRHDLETSWKIHSNQNKVTYKNVYLLFADSCEHQW